MTNRRCRMSSDLFKVGYARLFFERTSAQFGFYPFIYLSFANLGILML